MFVKATIDNATNGLTIDAFNTRPKMTKPNMRVIHWQDMPPTTQPSVNTDAMSR